MIIFATENCDAILQAWYPGMMGGTAVAEVLYGKYNPGGKLPVTFYRNSEQLPDFENYDMKGRTYRYISDDTALFPFGHGLSYTTFNVGTASLSSSSLSAGGQSEIKVTIPVENTGKMDGTEIVQLYVRNPQDPEGPVMQLRGFERVNVKAGQTANAVIVLNAKSFEWFDEQSNTVHTKAGTYEILYGNSSAKNSLKSATVEVK